jgi:hypothetical protein
MGHHCLNRAILGGLALLAAVLVAKAAEKPHKLTTVSLRKMADSLAAVIAANHEVYVREITRRPGPDMPQKETALPGHARFLRMVQAEIQTKGAEFSYVLRSPWPIDESHGPQTAIEQEGLSFVVKTPKENRYAEETLGGRSYFTAVYPVIATQKACVDCHNHHPSSPRRDFRPGDVMGATVVRVPLEF